MVMVVMPTRTKTAKLPSDYHHQNSNS